MKKITALFTFLLLAALSLRAQVLFQDVFNYPDSCIETDGLWYAYSPDSPKQDALVVSNLLILNQANSDAVAAPSNNFTASDPVYASFTINVSALPTAKGGYFCQFKDYTNDYVSRIFIAATNTVVPGTYRLGIANASSSVATYVPLDLATGITYQVVFSYDVNNYLGYLWVNPASSGDYSVYGPDPVTNSLQQNIAISQIAFSQYAGQGVAAIGDVIVGQNFSDVLTNTPQIPVMGVQPQSITGLYSGDDAIFYSAASGLGQLSYQWLSNGIPISDGAYVSGSQSNILVLANLQAAANYSVVIANSAGSITSAVASVSVNTTPTAPFFTKQPYSSTNSLGSTIILSGTVSGTGPFSYQWYFSTNSSFSAIAGQTNATLYLTQANFAESGSYYLTVIGGAGSVNSDTVSVTVVPPATVTIGYLHSFLISNAPAGQLNINGSTVYNVQGVVTTFGAIISKTYSEYFIQDGTGGALVFVNGLGSTNTPPAGTLVSVTGSAQQYYGQLELVPSVTNTSSSVTSVSSGNPLPAVTPLNFSLMATNPSTPYGLGIQGSLVTMTNVYLYSSSSGAAVSGNFPTNSTKALYAFAQPYSSGQPYIEVYVYTYTNAVNNLSTNLWGQPIPGHVYQLTGNLIAYSATVAEFYPTRFVDFVSSLPASFPAGATISNGVSQITWPAVSGSTYSIYSATNLLGPWTQTFGLSYYPSTGIYTDTNTAAAKFYRVSTP